jgi:hypothetical protein
MIRFWIWGNLKYFAKFLGLFLIAAVLMVERIDFVCVGWHANRWANRKRQAGPYFSEHRMVPILIFASNRASAVNCDNAYTAFCTGLS